MKILALLSCAAAVSALPIHADIRVIKVDSKGVAQVQNIPNVDLDDYKSLKELADAAHSNTLHSDTKEAKGSTESKAVEQKAASVSDEDKAFFENMRKASVDLFNSIFGTPEQESKDSKENAKELKKLEKPKPHAVKIDVEKMKKAQKHCDRRKKLHKLITLKHESESKNSNDNTRTFGENHANTLEQFYDDKLSQTQQNEQATTSTASKSLLDALKELYQDVRSINYKESLKRISQDTNAICAVGTGVFLGISFYLVLSIIFIFIKSRIHASRNQAAARDVYESDEEESEYLNEEAEFLDEKHLASFVE